MALPVDYMERLLDGRGLLITKGRKTKLVKLRKPVDACVIDITSTQKSKCLDGKAHRFHVLHDSFHYCLLITIKSKCFLFNPLGIRDTTSVPFLLWCKGQVFLYQWTHARLQMPAAITCGYWTLAFAQALVANLHRSDRNSVCTKFLERTYRQIACYNDMRIKSCLFNYCIIKNG